MSNGSKNSAFKGHVFFVWKERGNYLLSYHIGLNRLISRSEVTGLKKMQLMDVSLFFKNAIAPGDDVTVICIENPELSEFTDESVNVTRSCSDLLEVKDTLLKLAKENNVTINFREKNNNGVSDGF
ncbi:TPA: hypothetical protein ACU3EH_004663 [Salmonella enterica]